MIYSEYLKTPEWQAKRNERLKIDNFRCQKCGRPMDLQVHHINYDHVGHENVYTDLITLCKYCHAKIEAQKTEYKTNLYRDYADKYKAARRLELQFCADCRNKDFSQGGHLNMLNRDVIWAEWSKWLADNYPFDLDDGLRITTVMDYFRDIRIEIILNMSEAGAPPDAILAKGISNNMVKKYYNNRELAEKVLTHSRKERQSYAET